MMLEDEILRLDVNKLVYDYQNYGIVIAVKYGLCKAIKTAYNRFMVSFIDTEVSFTDTYISLKTSVVDSSNYNNVIINSNEFTEILEQYFFNVKPATNREIGIALINTINELFVKCIDYVEKQANYYYNF